MRSDKVWVLGDAVVDLLPDSDGRLLKCPGGAPANVAVGVARLGGESGFVGRVGDDPFGRFMIDTLRQEGVDTQYMYADPLHRTSTVVVDLDDDGERSFTFMVRPSADLFTDVDDLPAFQAGEWLHTCSIALCAEPSRTAAFTAMERIRQIGGYVSFDPNIRSDLWQDEQTLAACLDRALAWADVVKLSVEELAFISDQASLTLGITQLAGRYPGIRLLLVTRGKEGVLARFRGENHVFPARPVVCVDTTGAGDAFVAGLLEGLARRGIPETLPLLEEILNQAQRCGALATTAKGAMTALPHRHEMELSL